MKFDNNTFYGSGYGENQSSNSFEYAPYTFDQYQIQINSNNTIIRQNEQSMSIKVNDLQPKDSRAVYKNLNFDMRQYKTLKMYIHAESLEGSTKLPGEGATEEFDKRLVGFIRIGSDFTDNYYQIEVPLKPTSFNQNSSNRYSADQVWEPESNSIDFSLEKLTQLKAIAIANNSNLSEVLYFNDELEIIDNPLFQRL